MLWFLVFDAVLYLTLYQEAIKTLFIFIFIHTHTHTQASVPLDRYYHLQKKQRNIFCVSRLRISLSNLYLYSLRGRMSYRQISWSLEAARLDAIIIASFWNLTGISVARILWGTDIVTPSTGTLSCWVSDIWLAQVTHLTTPIYKKVFRVPLANNFRFSHV